MEHVIYREMMAGEEAAVIALVEVVFNEFVALDYEEAGIQEFFNFANREAMMARMRNGGFVLVAELQGKLVGVLEFFPPNGIAMLFVTLRKQGIAQGLLSRSIEKALALHPSLSKLVVHSSPYAAEIYEKLGFHRSGPRTKENGIEYIPMELALNQRSA
jgi:GNAT superfamily N-acetyltransferase